MDNYKIDLSLSEWELIKDILQEKIMQSTSESLDATIAMILVVIEGVIIKEKELIPNGSCNICGRPFRRVDMEAGKSRPEGICLACFTSNA